MAGPELLLVSAGLQIVQGIQAQSQAKAQAKIAQQTAAYNAQVIENQGAAERAQMQRQQRLFASQQRVRAAGSGATLESFGDVYEDTTTQSLLDLALQDYNTKLRRDQAIYGGQVDAYSAKAEGKSKLLGSVINASSTGYEYYKAKYPQEKTYYNR